MHAIPKPLPSPSMYHCVQKWYADYVDLKDNDDLPQLLQLMVTANVLAIPPLIELTCGKVASLMKGKTPEEITVFFKIPPASEDEDE